MRIKNLTQYNNKNLGVARFILGMEIKTDNRKNKIWLKQRKHVETIFQRFSMDGCKSVKVPILVGEN